MKFELIFDGKALDNHEMDPKELSIALIAIDNIMKEANAVLNHNRVKISVKVKGSFETGCFKINMAISLFEHVKDLLTSNGVEATINAIEIFGYLFVGMTGLVSIIKFLRGLAPTKIFENEDGTLKIYKGNKFLIAEKRTYELYKNYKIRKAFENLTSPVRDNDGIDDLSIKLNKEDYCTINKTEVSYFICPEAEEEKIDGAAIYETSLSVINLSFKEGNKWYVNDGDASFYVTVEDHDFLNKIDQSQIAFTKGDLLRVKIRKEQSYDKTNHKLKSEHYVQEVIKHERPTSLFD